MKNNKPIRSDEEKKTILNRINRIKGQISGIEKMINRAQIKDKISTGKDKLIMPNSKIVSDFENYDNDRETVQVEVQKKNMIEQKRSYV